MNRTQSATTMKVLAANWPKLLQVDDVDVLLELWYRNALRYTPEVDAEEIVGRLVATMTYQPKPADWCREHDALKADRRRGKRATPINRSDLPELETGDEPVLSEAERKVSIARLRESIREIGAAKEATFKER